MDHGLREYRYHHESASLRWGAATHVGMRRRINEDSVVASFPAFLVADGMGGHSAGDRASSLAIGSFESLLGPTLPKPDQVESALQRAFGAVLAAGAEGAGTTMTGGVLVHGDCGVHWYFVNIGDSRTYVLSGGQLEQISVDHSVVQEMIDSGEMSQDEARIHPMRNVITRSIGGGVLTKPDTWMVPVERSQRLLVCSDGLTGEVDDQTIARVLRAHPSPSNAAGELLQLALQAGARDNVSIIVVDVDAVDSDDGWQDTNQVLVTDTVPRGR